MDSAVLFLHGRGQSADEIRSLDWSRKPIGVPGNWPAPLVTAVQMMLASQFPKAIIWGPEYTTIYNDAFRPILGEKENCMGASFRDIWFEVWDELLPMVQKAYAGEATFIEDYPLVIDRHGYDEQCYFTFCYSPIFDEQGRVGGMIDTVIETTEKVESEKHAKILDAELAHRIKNTFSVVSAIASQTFNNNADEEVINTFTKRLFALGNAHDVLRLGKSSEGSLRQIVSGITTALAVAERVHMSGPDVMIGPKGASTLSLLIHELTTNAIKYGALSNDSGQVQLNIAVSKKRVDPVFSMNWTEVGGPLVTQPTKTGFGSKLIRMGLLGSGEVRSEFRPEGFNAEFSAPLRQLQGEGRLFGST
ncbi:sensor histidine kinase [Ochrobactrum soli]|uniref:histidine kinase n=1 Tax=Ochrobactrum soli TaxID=2448455 RepID=A0A849KXT7_9HYPH|nr:PAS domain-containing sensor histidine kinase [[Ochrobactrum] soli]NNU60872.1 PAS domain-containing protein [[Ochrobactrum] soli]